MVPSPAERSSRVNISPAAHSKLFLYNPLHDYESVWFVLHSKFEGVSDDALGEVQAKVYKYRHHTFSVGFPALCQDFPSTIKPFCEPLKMMNYYLTRTYRTFEETFEGSDMLSIAGFLKQCLSILEERARGMSAALPKTSPKRTRDEADLVEASTSPPARFRAKFHDNN